MNNIKYLFLLILCVGIIGGITHVAAQNGGDVLAAAEGKSLRQSEVDKVIEFYEWAFETKFTGEQRSEFSSIQTENFRKDAAGEKKGISDILNTFAAVRAKNDNDQNKLRQAFNADFVEQLRGGRDGESKLLLSIYDSAQTASESETSASDGGGDISSIAGKWVWSRTGSSTISTIGTYMGSNGSRFTYQFSPNGAVEFTGFMNVMMGGCSQQVFQLRKGQATLSGSTLTIRWQPEKFTRDFSCDTANNYTKTMPAKTEKLQIKFKDDLGQKQLCILGSECFSPTK